MNNNARSKNIPFFHDFFKNPKYPVFRGLIGFTRNQTFTRESYKKNIDNYSLKQRKQFIMKKLLLITILSAIAMGNLYAQFKTTKTIKNTQNLNLEIPPPPPPAANKTSGPLSNSNASASVYTLTAVRVNIRTGGDNKEFPSKVIVWVKHKNAGVGDWSPFNQLNLDNEMRINSDTEFGLQRQEKLYGDVKLESFQNSGLVLQIKYYPNFFADAWKIENVSLTMEFKDQFGNLHPTLGRKIIAFNNAYGFLNNDYQVMECVADGTFSPLSAMIKK